MTERQESQVMGLYIFAGHARTIPFSETRRCYWLRLNYADRLICLL